MFMLTSLINIIVAVAIAVLAILGYQYQVEGAGLHPVLCFTTALSLCILAHYLTTLLSVHATHAYRAKHYPKG